MKQRIALAALKRLPRNHVSRVAGMAAATPVPRPLRPAVLGAAAKIMHIDAGEAEKNIGEYRSLNDFFTRKLQPGARPVADIPGGLVSPADGYLTRFGTIENGSIVQAKGHSYSVAELLDDEQKAARYTGGAFATVYLTPRNYHRVHSPVAGSITEARIIPGTLYPVYPAATESIDRLFIKNERLVIHLDTHIGHVCAVLVGASNVGTMTAAFDNSIKTNRGPKRLRARRFQYNPAIPVEQGGELGAFNLGSTVVVLWERSDLVIEGEEGQEILFGQLLARPE